MRFGERVLAGMAWAPSGKYDKQTANLLATSGVRIVVLSSTAMVPVEDGSGIADYGTSAGVIDAVLVHELAHLMRADHGPEFVRLIARSKPLAGEVRVIRHFDESFTRLWERIGGEFTGIVRRDAKYLNWRFIQPPHVRYTVAALYRDGEAAGYVVYRHVQEPRGRATRLIDFFADPHDEDGVLTLLRFVDREAQAADSDKIRVYATHAGFRKLLRKNGYYPWRSHTELVARINAVPVDAAFYASADGWHITAGDSDHDH